MLSPTHGISTKTLNVSGYHLAAAVRSSAVSRSVSSTPSVTQGSAFIWLARQLALLSSQSACSNPANGFGGSGVLVGRGVNVGRGVRVGVGLAVAVGLGLGVNVGAGVLVGGTGVSVGIGSAVAVGDGVKVGVTSGSGDGVAVTTTTVRPAGAGEAVRAAGCGSGAVQARRATLSASNALNAAVNSGQVTFLRRLGPAGNDADLDN